eukprot:4437638-Amphidinium_carterae.1
MCGKSARGKSLISASISVSTLKDGAEAHRLCAAAPVGWWAADFAPWASAVAASIWHVKHIWKRQSALIGQFQCVRAIHTLMFSR